MIKNDYVRAMHMKNESWCITSENLKLVNYILGAILSFLFLILILIYFSSIFSVLYFVVGVAGEDSYTSSLIVKKITLFYLKY